MLWRQQEVLMLIRRLVFGGKAGIAYFVNQGAAITGYVGYDSYSLKNKANSKSETQRGTLGVGVGVALFF